MIRESGNRHVGWDDSTGLPINEYVFACSEVSELPTSPYLGADGSEHIIAHGSRAWVIGDPSVYGYNDGSWVLQFTMGG